MGIDQTFEIGEGMTKPDTELPFYRDGEAIVWADESVSEVLFYAVEVGSPSNVIVDGVAGATGPDGVLAYRGWTALQTATPGRYYGYFKVTYIGGPKEKLPAANDFVVFVR